MIHIKISKILKQKGIKIGVLAKFLGICPNSLSLKLKGKRDFKATELQEIAKFLCIDVRELFPSQVEEERK